MKKLLSLCLCLSLLFPTLALAQSSSEPGQDPFALSDELLRFFGAEPADSDSNSDTGSLFNGDSMINNGLFTTPSTQLGGASPLTAPLRTNQEDLGPTMIMLTSKYEPAGDLTSKSVIKVTITAKNVGLNLARDLTLRATLQDTNADLLPRSNGQDQPPSTDTPQPPTLDLTAQPPSPAITTDSNISDPAIGLIWRQKGTGQPFNLAIDESADFVFYIQAQKDDTVLRWKFETTYGSGVSTLLQWIPIKNPNPTGILAPGQLGPGLSTTCTTNGSPQPFPESSGVEAIITQFAQKWKINLVDGGSSWRTPQYMPLLKIYWETLLAVECTPFLGMITKSGPLNLEAGSNPSLWGDFTSPPNLRMHLPNILNSVSSNPENVQQNLIHELGHVLRGRDSAMYSANEQICGTGSPNAYVSGYGDTNCSENLSEILGYYAIRASKEWGIGAEYCPAKNPYDWGQSKYYQWAKTTVFGNIEFGPPAPESGAC